MRAARDQRNRESREMKRKKVEFDPSSNGESERFPLLKKLLHLSFIFLSRELWSSKCLLKKLYNDLIFNGTISPFYVRTNSFFRYSYSLDLLSSRRVSAPASLPADRPPLRVSLSFFSLFPFSFLSPLFVFLSIIVPFSNLFPCGK